MFVGSDLWDVTEATDGLMEPRRNRPEKLDQDINISKVPLGRESGEQSQPIRTSRSTWGYFRPEPNILVQLDPKVSYLGRAGLRCWVRISRANRVPKPRRFHRQLDWSLLVIMAV